MNIDITALPFLALYAETHFRFFRFFPSLIFRKQPEILFDMPKRIKPGNDIPIVLILNDIDSYPLDLINVTIVISQKGSSSIAFSENCLEQYLIKHPFAFQSSVYLFTLPRRLFCPGKFSVNGKVTYKDKKHTYTVINDNLVTSSKSALTGFIAEDNIPGNEWCEFSDLHIHSQYSQSHVEFGPPINVIDTMASAYGLSCIGITDHSYDLACKMHNYLKKDPEIKRWETILKENIEGNSSFKTNVILGEEISVLNKKNRVIHLGALGIKEYIPGSKDSGRLNQDFKIDGLRLPDAIQNIENQGGISFAAHPGASVGLLQRVFLNRSPWQFNDIDSNQNLHILQAINNGFADSWYRARKLWISILLKRRKISIIAGNDAHGDFNRYRSLDIPFFSINENFNRYLSYAMTGIYGKHKTKESILDAIKQGKTFVTTGPCLGMNSTDSMNNSVISNKTISYNITHLFILATTTYEFGIPSVLRIFRGYYKSCIEKLISIYYFKDQDIKSIIKKIELDLENGPGYLRAEFICLKEDGTETIAACSPCYF